MKLNERFTFRTYSWNFLFSLLYGMFVQLLSIAMIFAPFVYASSLDLLLTVSSLVFKRFCEYQFLQLFFPPYWSLKNRSHSEYKSNFFSSLFLKPFHGILMILQQNYITVGSNLFICEKNVPHLLSYRTVNIIFIAVFFSFLHVLCSFCRPNFLLSQVSLPSARKSSTIHCYVE